jgi:2'-5' RNA ligase
MNLITHSGLGVRPRDERPIYLMFKPSPAKAREIESRRRILGIESNYGHERFHITALPIGDARHLSSAQLEQLNQALARFHAEPFDIGFDRLKGNALVGGKAMGAVRRFQARLVEHLITCGWPVFDYAFHPHLSLTYGAWQERNIAIPPIGWRVEELLLIKSIQGQGRHEPLGAWPLQARQLSLGL